MKVTILVFESYLATIQNSIGSKMFQNLWTEIDGKREDILRGGQRSCAVFVSGVLLQFGLIKERHAMSASTVRDMLQCGWEEIKEPRKGAVLHWGKRITNGEENEHIGFYMENDIAISHSRDNRTPIEHHWTYGTENGKPNYAPIGIYWHPKFN